MSQVVESVVEDPFIEKTTQHPEVYKICRSKNRIQHEVYFDRTVSKIQCENKLELKRINSEMVSLNKELRRLQLDKKVYQRSDKKDTPKGFVRRKSLELEDISLPSELRAASEFSGHSTLTAFAQYHKADTEKLKKAMRAISEEKLETLSDLRQYQYWEGDPGAINSVRRDLKPRSRQLTDMLYTRSRKFDEKNRELESRASVKSVAESRHSKDD